MLPLLNLFHKSTNQEEYQFASYPGFPNIPPHVVVVPESEKYDSRKEFDSFVTLMKGFLSKISNHSRLTDFKQWTSPEQYMNFFAHKDPTVLDKIFAFPIPSAQAHWTDDLKWADQFVNGPNPNLIKAISTTEAEKFVMEMDAKAQYYILDHSDLLGCEAQPGCVLYAPQTLFHLNAKGRLDPLAIWLRPTNTHPDAKPEKNELFYYDGPKDVWLYAKICVSSADANHHEVLTHLAYCHQLMETIIVAAHQTLPEDHPLMKLLEPHFHRTIFINNGARSTLISTTDEKASFSFNEITSLGVQESLKLANRCFPRYSWTKHAHFARNAEDRDVVGISHYYYYDYGYDVWNCIGDYVRAVVWRIYDNDTSKDGIDEAIARDEKLQAFARCCSGPGKICDFPSVIKEEDDLVSTLTTIIFTASAQHAAVNFNQYDYYAFIPNRPLQLHKAMPTDAHEREQINKEWIVKALPNQYTSMQMIVLAKLLTTHSSDDYMVHTLHYNDLIVHKNGPKAAYPKEYAAFVAEMDKLEQKQRKRNAVDGSNYDLFYASKLPLSVSI